MNPAPFVRGCQLTPFTYTVHSLSSTTDLNENQWNCQEKPGGVIAKMAPGMISNVSKSIAAALSL